MNYVIRDGSLYHSDDELRHYGVLGMKWGIHRARKKGTTYSYKSHATKKYEKKAANAKDKSTADYYKRKAKRSADFDKKMETSVRKSSAGKTACKVLLNGPWGAKSYEAVKAATGDRIYAQAATMAGAYLAGPLGNVAVTALARRSYVNR